MAGTRSIPKQAFASSPARTGESPHPPSERRTSAFDIPSVAERLERHTMSNKGTLDGRC